MAWFLMKPSSLALLALALRILFCSNGAYSFLSTSVVRQNFAFPHASGEFRSGATWRAPGVASSLVLRPMSGTASDTLSEQSSPSLRKGSVPVSKTTSALMSEKSKFRQLKDRMWVRSTLEDLTAAKFACSLDASVTTDGNDANNKNERAVDFEKLLSTLDMRVEEMCTAVKSGEVGVGANACYPLEEFAKQQGDQVCYSLVPGQGMGSVVYKDDQREALLLRLLATRQDLIESMEGHVENSSSDKSAAEVAGDLDDIRVQLQDSTISPADVKEATGAAGRPSEMQIGDPRLYIRDDGTVDWDGALQDRAALKKFGTSVWARINGQDPETVDENSIEVSANAAGGETTKAVTAKIVETQAIRDKKALLGSLEKEYAEMQKAHTALLNSAVRAGQAVANINLATLDPALRSKIRSSAAALEMKEEEVSFQKLNYELERIFTYLEGEMGNTALKGPIPLQDRLNVAEFGLLESQIESLNKQLEDGEYIDTDVLAVVSDQLTDFKRRLGIDYYVTGLTYDGEALKRWLNDLILKANEGLAFYVKGCRLFWNDILFCLNLIGRALRGYTLKPREVRTLRRTFKDVITFVPVVIILIIPLTPVGHVLVFGAIQRFFPDFFPSCFTERRQNLLQLYESTEYSEVTINENFQEKMVRALEAGGFLVSDSLRKLYERASAKGDDNPTKS